MNREPYEWLRDKSRTDELTRVYTPPARRNMLAVRAETVFPASTAINSNDENFRIVYRTLEIYIEKTKTLYRFRYRTNDKKFEIFFSYTRAQTA